MGYENHPRLQAIIDHSAAGDNIVIVGTPGNTIIVYALTVVLDGDTFLTVQSASTPLTGAMMMLAAGSIVLDDERHPWYVCEDGEDFVLNSTNAVQLSGRVYYTQSATDTL